jgi:hypothetical protein
MKKKKLFNRGHGVKRKRPKKKKKAGIQIPAVPKTTADMQYFLVPHSSQISAKIIRNFFLFNNMQDNL